MWLHFIKICFKKKWSWVFLCERLPLVPLSVALTAGVSTTRSVTATWDIPGGIVDEFEVECSNGTASIPNNGSDQDYFASCEAVDSPGDNYTMTVTSLSNTQRNSATIVLTACKLTTDISYSAITTMAISLSWTYLTCRLHCTNHGDDTRKWIKLCYSSNTFHGFIMVVTSLSNTQRNSATIVLTAYM